MSSVRLAHSRARVTRDEEAWVRICCCLLADSRQLGTDDQEWPLSVRSGGIASDMLVTISLFVGIEDCRSGVWVVSVMPSSAHFVIVRRQKTAGAPRCSHQRVGKRCLSWLLSLELEV